MHSEPIHIGRLLVRAKPENVPGSFNGANSIACGPVNLRSGLASRGSGMATPLPLPLLLILLAHFNSAPSFPSHASLSCTFTQMSRHHIKCVYSVYRVYLSTTKNSQQSHIMLAIRVSVTKKTLGTFFSSFASSTVLAAKPITGLHAPVHGTKRLN